MEQVLQVRVPAQVEAAVARREVAVDAVGWGVISQPDRAENAFVPHAEKRLPTSAGSPANRNDVRHAARR